MAKWEEFNGDILMEIAKRLRRLEDYAAFRRVCRYWLSVATKENYRFCPIPWLMLAPRKDSHLRDFYNPVEGVIHSVNLPQLTGKRCYSSKGCLVTVGQDLNVNLLHPFSNIQIKLPHITTIEDWDSGLHINLYDRYINKCVLSSSPLSMSDYVVMIILRSRTKLAYAKAGDESWTIISRNNYHDVTYYKGRFYAVTCRREIVACSIRDDNSLSEIEEVAQLPLTLLSSFPDKLYLVELRGTLLVISRYLEESHNGYGKYSYTTFKFQVFKVDLSFKRFIEIKDLDGRIIFLGHNSSFLLAPGEIQNSNFKPNSIYFTDDDMLFDEDDDGAGKDMGIYNLEDGSITPHFNGKSLDRITPPIWVEQPSI